jgi:hypothetical protein
MKKFEYIDPYELDEGYRLGNPGGGMPKWVTDEAAIAMWKTVMRPVLDKDGKVAVRCADTVSQVLTRTIDRFLDEKNEFRREYGMPKLTKTTVYERAKLSRANWGRIMSGQLSDIERGNVFALAIALELNAEQTAELLYAAGFAINYELDLDVAMMYFIRNEIYDMDKINEILGYFCDVDNGLDCFMFQPKISPAESRALREAKNARRNAKKPTA